MNKYLLASLLLVGAGIAPTSFAKITLINKVIIQSVPVDVYIKAYASECDPYKCPIIGIEYTNPKKIGFNESFTFEPKFLSSENKIEKISEKIAVGIDYEPHVIVSANHALANGKTYMIKIVNGLYGFTEQK